MNIEIIDICDDLPKHPTKRYGLRLLSRVTEITIHHSATQPTKRQDAKLVLFGIASYHIQSRDWPGIGYSYAVDSFGKVYQVNYLSTKCYHNESKNTTSIGVVFLGNFEKESPTKEQYESGAKLMALIQLRLGRNLSIVGHNASKKKGNKGGTACPGKNFDLSKLE